MASLKDIITWQVFTRKYTRRCENGVICEFDRKFYSQFEGMYFNGLPVYYYLSPVYANGRCYDVSEILALALGDCHICRGELKSQKLYWGEDGLGHGWVEKDGYVYDTTWSIYCPVDVYKRVFKAVTTSRECSQSFFENVVDDEDWNIHDKGWYDKKNLDDYPMIEQVRKVAKKQLELTSLFDEEKEFWQKVLVDLPGSDEPISEEEIAEKL